MEVFWDGGGGDNWRCDRIYTGRLCQPDPARLVHKALFKELERSSTSKLWEIAGEDEWNFRNSLALLNLSVRGEDVKPVLPRIISMLESDSTLTRRFGWDALRLVYNDETNAIGDYDPLESLEECRRKIAVLKNSNSSPARIGFNRDNQECCW